jgi:hypothetical protein
MSTRDDFWRRWSPWRHGAAGQGNFADVMRVLRTYETFAAYAAAHVEPASAAVTVLDLGCGAAPMAMPLARALEARGGSLRRYVGVDHADPVWMPARVADELARHGLADRAEYLHHDLARGLPDGLPARLGSDGPLLITSCWGITYLDPEPLAALLRACAALAAGRPGGAALYINLMSAGQFDRDVLTRRFLGEIVPRHLWAAARDRDLEPLRRIRLALRALPQMRVFGDEVKHLAKLMPVSDLLAILRSVGYEPTDLDPSALWGQTTSLMVRLP